MRFFVFSKTSRHVPDWGKIRILWIMWKSYPQCLWIILCISALDVDNVDNFSTAFVEKSRSINAIVDNVDNFST